MHRTLDGAFESGIVDLPLPWLRQWCRDLDRYLDDFSLLHVACGAERTLRPGILTCALEPPPFAHIFRD